MNLPTPGKKSCGCPCIRDGFLSVKTPNQQCQSTKRMWGPKEWASIPSGPHHRVIWRPTLNNSFVAKYVQHFSQKSLISNHQC